MSSADRHRRFGIENVSHDYSGVQVVKNVDFELRPGEVHALIGENGSGKSTVIKILTGAVKPRSGRIYLDDETVAFHNPGAARSQGIGVVHQDYNLFPELTVAQNVYGVSVAPPRRRWTRMIDRGELSSRIGELFDALHIEIPPDRLVRNLDAAERKFVEIARAMLLKPQFLILDEPTASLEPEGSRTVLELLRRLREQGVGLMFVSHRLDEVRVISDAISVLRDGRLVERIEPSEATEERLANAITGGVETVPTRSRPQRGAHEPLLRVEDVRVAGSAPPVTLEIGRGEIFGLTGLLGSGCAQLTRMIGGAEPLRGRALLGGEEITLRTPRDASRHGIGFIPEDRKAVGLIPEQSVAINISLSALGSVSKNGVLSQKLISERAHKYRDRLTIRTASIYQPVMRLSGGNMQKVLLAKWLASGVSILAIEEPTHGIDIGGKAQVHELLRDFADNGGTVLIASTDAAEVLELCDRVGVMRHGALARLVSVEEMTRASLTADSTRDPEQVLDQLISSDEPEQPTAEPEPRSAR
jgi:ABC-type sugar transport system ATPase subunit